MIEEIKIALTALESGMVEGIANEAMIYHQSLFSLADNGIRDSINNWAEKIKAQLSTTPIDIDTDGEIKFYQQVKDYNNDFFSENIEQTIENIGKESVFYEQAKELANEQKMKNAPFFQQHFCEQWYHSLLNNLKEERLKNIEKDKLLADLYQRSDTLSKLTEIEGDISEQKNLRLWDMGRAKLSKRDISQLSKITHFLQQHHQLHDIAKKLGRMALQVDTTSITDIEVEKTQKIETTSTYAAGDIVGIHNSNNLERLLSTESMYLTSPELETIFYKRFADKGLSTYQLQSTEERNETVITLDRKSVV